MLYYKDNRAIVSSSPHSLGLQNAMTIPSPGFDENLLLIGEKKALAAGLQGLKGLTSDGTGLLGTLFSGSVDTWGIPEAAFGVVAGYVLYSVFHTTKHAYDYGRRLPQERRKKRAKELRRKADEIEGRRGRRREYVEEGSFF